MSVPRRGGAIIATWLSVALAMATAAQAQTTAGPEGGAQGIWRDQIHWIPMTDAAGAQHLLQARICRPSGDQPVRVVAIAHGTFSDARRMQPSRCEGEAARWFLDRGFAVVMALRRGYGATGGDWAEGIWHRPCAEPDYAAAGLETARDIAATVDYATALTFARPRAAVVIGTSGGGWGALAYDSIDHPRASALISISGGRGHYRREPGVAGLCRPDLLAKAAGSYARTATTPMLWVYAENDSFFPPDVARSLYEAYAGNGGRAEFRQVGPFGEEGHRLLFGGAGAMVWGPLVEGYLAEQPAE